LQGSAALKAVLFVKHNAAKILRQRKIALPIPTEGNK